MKRLFLVFIIIMLFILPGCWDYLEYEDMALISVIGVDYDTNSKQVTFSVQYLLPSGTHSSSGESSGKSTSMTVFESAVGLTIPDAIEELEQHIGKRLFYGYTEIEIIGEDAAKNIMQDIIDLNDRTPEIRTTTYAAIAKGKAVDAVSTIEPDISSTSGKHIRDIIVNSVEYGYSYAISKQDFAESMAISGLEPVAPYLLTTQFQQDNSNSSGDTGKSPGSAGNKKTGEHKVDGLAVFLDSRLVGSLDANESIGFGWITGKNIKPYDTLKVSQDADTQNTLAFRLTKSNSKIKVAIQDGKPVVNVNIKTEVDLRKYVKNTDSKFLTPDVISMLKKKVEEDIVNKASITIQKVQKTFKSDIFGFGFALFRQHPKAWHSQYEKTWPKVFPDIPVIVKANVKIIHTGTNIMRSNEK